MDDLLARIWSNLGGRIGGPMSFRLILQPLVATILAIRAGVDDARANRAPYFWSIVNRPDERRDLLHQGWKAITRVFVFAVVMDAIYQIVVFRWVYPGEILMVAFLLACVPYLIFRGLANRVAGLRR